MIDLIKARQSNSYDDRRALLTLLSLLFYYWSDPLFTTLLFNDEFHRYVDQALSIHPFHFFWWRQRGKLWVVAVARD